MALSVGIASDHGGFVIKTGLLSWLKSEGYEVTDLGANIFDPEDDYPDYAEKLSENVLRKNIDRGILICGSGVGATIAANKFPRIRACLCHDTYSAHQGVEDDNMNILCLGGRVIGLEMAKELSSVFLKANFKDQEKYQRRLEKIISIENKMFKAQNNE
jgi:ribose 5-phosphate isomerase B